MSRFLVLSVTTTTLLLATAPAATAVTSTLSLTLGTLPPASFAGAIPGGSSAGYGGTASMPAGALSGVFTAPISPPLLGLFDRVGFASGGFTGSFTGIPPATSSALEFDGVRGTMSLNASAYLLMGTSVGDQIPLGVVGSFDVQDFPIFGTLVHGLIVGNPYQLGMVTVMGTFLAEQHTLVGTGVDNRTVNGQGTLVLVSPTTVSLGSFGSLAGISTLTVNYVIPEPGTLLLLATGVFGLAAIGRRQMGS